MNSFNPSFAPLFFLLVFLKFSHAIGNDTVVCPKIEKQALLNFKQSLKNSSSLSSSWIGEVNCCRWEGVVCNNLTGHVEELRLRGCGLSGKLKSSLLNLTHLRHLDLSFNDFKGTIPSFIGSFSSLEHLDLSDAGFHGKLKSSLLNLTHLMYLNLNSNNFKGTIPSFIGSFSSLKHLDLSYVGFHGKLKLSLLNLTHLKYLDLSYNDFRGTIPPFLGSLSSLEYLDLSNAGFHGTLPYTIGNLSNLHTLNLEFGYSQQHRVDNLEWLLGLSRLEHLNMQSVDLSNATDWVQVINNLPSLAKLSFSNCSLNFTAPLNGANISTSLTLLNLSENNLEEPLVVPSWIFQISSLIFLDLADNNFQGSIPSTSNTTNLRRLDLSSNNFNSTIWLYFLASAIANLSSLVSLDLSFNELSGKIPREIRYLSKLRELDLSDNNLQGEIPDSIGNMSNLQILELSGNQLSGAIPTNLGKLSSLVEIDVEDNMLTGNLPESLGQLFHLEYFDITDNKLEGAVTEKHFTNLTKLVFLCASRNNLTLKVNPNWVPPFKLETLELGSWNLGAGTAIPSWIHAQKYSITKLDLSNTGIFGTIPKWFWKVDFLDLSHNQLFGKIPNIIPDENGTGFQYLYLSSNRFCGTLPRVATSVVELDLSDNSFSGDISHFLSDTANATYKTRILRLGGNKLSGELPNCLTNWPSLAMLHFENNNISGSIPNSLGFLQNLESLDLHGNNISGQIPLAILNCTGLAKIDLSHNELDGNIPSGMGTSLSNLTILVLRSNKLSGKISSDICHLNFLKILDLSSNNFFGVIPRCVDNFTALATKINYTFKTRGGSMESVSISTKGRVLVYNVTLALVTNIDLSENNFVGDIPTEFTSLAELRSLNLSGNHLTGFIPSSIGDMKQLESLDLSRNSLSGGIPNSFAIMSFLNYLNLSYNNLKGRIPESTQLCSLDPSSFMGNNLHGPPLTSNCGHDHDRVSRPTIQDDSEGENSKVEWLYVFLSLGYAVGVSAVCAALVLKKSWRDAYFGFLGEVGDKIYLFFCVQWRRLVRAWHPSP